MPGKTLKPAVACRGFPGEVCSHGENNLPIELPEETGQTNVPQSRVSSVAENDGKTLRRDPFSTAMISVGFEPHPIFKSFPSMLKSSPLFHLAMAAVLCLLVGCGPAASGKSSRKGTKKAVAKKA